MHSPLGFLHWASCWSVLPDRLPIVVEDLPFVVMNWLTLIYQQISNSTRGPLEVKENTSSPGGWPSTYSLGQKDDDGLYRLTIITFKFSFFSIDCPSSNWSLSAQSSYCSMYCLLGLEVFKSIVHIVNTEMIKTRTDKNDQFLCCAYGHILVGGRGKFDFSIQNWSTGH